MDPEYVKDRKVFGHVLAAFRYGREDLDVLGLTFRKDLYLAAEQIYPPTSSTTKKTPTRLQVNYLPEECFWMKNDILKNPFRIHKTRFMANLMN